jgi:hypothetical protein
MDRWMDGWMDRRMDGWTDGQMDGWLDGKVSEKSGLIHALETILYCLSQKSGQAVSLTQPVLPSETPSC